MLNNSTQFSLDPPIFGVVVVQQPMTSTDRLVAGEDGMMALGSRLTAAIFSPQCAQVQAFSVFLAQATLAITDERKLRHVDAKYHPIYEHRWACPR
jgi:hypothetical protein